MTALRDCTDPATWWPHVDEATKALAVGGLVVLPTDTVYGIAADAFKPEAVQALLDAKGRGRQMPPPVLIGDVRTMDGLADAIPDEVREMVTAHWPGPLTVILQAQPSLQWDLGETHGTVALRMPDHELALAVLRRTGPLAVSSANSTGSPAATTAAEAASMLGESVRVYLDGGTSPGGVASTIVDATGDKLRILREGALSAADLGIEEETGADEGSEVDDAPGVEDTADVDDAAEGEETPAVEEATEPEDASELDDASEVDDAPDVEAASDVADGADDAPDVADVADDAVEIEETPDAEEAIAAAPEGEAAPVEDPPAEEPAADEQIEAPADEPADEPAPAPERPAATTTAGEGEVRIAPRRVRRKPAPVPESTEPPEPTAETPTP